MRLIARHLVTTAAIGTLLSLAPAIASAASAEAGKAVFAAKCKSCHGDDGAGNPKIAAMMKVEMKPLGGEEIQKKSDADLKGIITNGSGKMPAQKTVTGADVDNVVAAIRALKK